MTADLWTSAATNSCLYRTHSPLHLSIMTIGKSCSAMAEQHIFHSYCSYSLHKMLSYCDMITFYTQRISADSGCHALGMLCRSLAIILYSQAGLSVPMCHLSLYMYIATHKIAFGRPRPPLFVNLAILYIPYTHTHTHTHTHTRAHIIPF